MSDTPDFMLAEYLCACLLTFNATTSARATWHGIGKVGEE